MQRNYYVVPDDRGRWAISDSPYASDQGPSFRSYSEAFDHLRNSIESEGLAMSRPKPEGMGFRVEALDPPDPKSMFYSADALSMIEDVQKLLGRELMQRALDTARRGGRKLITDDDVWSAVDDMGIAHLVVDPDEEVGDGR
jgi:hypothetical protein